MFKYAIALACVLGTPASAQESFSPARFRGGAVPSVSVRAVGGGEVLLEADVDREGRVTAITPLRTTPPFTEMVTEAVRAWQFSPAVEETVSRTGARQRRPVAGKVLVAAVFRPPSLNTGTIGEPAKDAASPSEDIPFPLTTTVPPFPPRAYSSGVVLLEAQIDRNGAVTSADAIRSAPPFDSAAQESMSKWSFRPALHQRIRVPSIAYVVFGFPVPVGPGPNRSSPPAR